MAFKKQLTDQLMEYIKIYNKERAKPFHGRINQINSDI